MSIFRDSAYLPKGDQQVAPQAHTEQLWLSQLASKTTQAQISNNPSF